MSIRDPVSEGAPTLVGNLQRKDVKALDAVAAGREMLEPPRTPHLARPDWEMRWRHRAREDLLGVTARLLRYVQGGARVGVVHRRAERQAVGVIPVEMGQQHAAGEGLAVQCGGQPAQTRARIEDEPVLSVIRYHRHTRRLTP